MPSRASRELDSKARISDLGVRRSARNQTRWDPIGGQRIATATKVEKRSESPDVTALNIASVKFEPDIDVKLDDVKPLVKVEDEDMKVEFQTRVQGAVRVKKEKEDFGLDEPTVRSRLNVLGRDLEIPLNDVSQVTFPRAFLSAMLGGSAQDTHPRPSKRRFAHDIKLLCLKYSFNPNAPRFPGQNGLSNAGNRLNGKPGHIFVCQSPKNWLFVGVYELHSVPALTPTEWKLQLPIVRSTWSQYHAKYVDLRAECYLCQKLGRPVSDEEVRAALLGEHEIQVSESRSSVDPPVGEDGSDFSDLSDSEMEDDVSASQVQGERGNPDAEKFLFITAADILEQMDRGHMTLQPWGMKIVEYPEDFQRLLIREYAKWKKCPTTKSSGKAKKGKGKGKGKKSSGNAGPKYLSPFLR